MQHRGQTIIVVLIFVVTSTLLSVTFFEYLSQGIGLSGRQINYERVHNLAEAGINRALYELNLSPGWSGTGEILLGDGSYEVVLISSSSAQRIFEARGYIPNKANARFIRTMRITLTTGTGASFFYGIQSGRGGFRMENSARVNGSVYSGGNITGFNSASITGDAFVSGTSTISGMDSIGGNARAYAISNTAIARNASSTTILGSNVTVQGNAYADRLQNCTVSGNAYYQTSISGCSVGGTTYSGVPAPSSLPELPLPISDEQIAQWELDAEAGGVHTSPCPYEISGTAALGPRKINCDLTIRNDANVTIYGTVWVAGDLTIQNKSRVQLASGYGNNNGIIIVDNPANRLTSSRVTLENQATLAGSGASTSAILLISMNSSAAQGGNEIAINPENNSTQAIYYVPYGKLYIQNSSTFYEATAYLIHMINNTIVEYKSGLANANFTSGPTGGWNVKRGSLIIVE